MNYTHFMTISPPKPLLDKNLSRPPEQTAAKAPSQGRDASGQTPAKPKSRLEGLSKFVQRKSLRSLNATAKSAKSNEIELIEVTRSNRHAGFRTSDPGGAKRTARKTEVLNLRLLVEKEVERILGTQAPPQSPAMTLARERGAAYARDQYAKPENLSLLEAAKVSGRSERWVNARRNDGDYYALILDGNSRGFRYPQWQFDADAKRLRAILDILHEAGLSCWTIHNFLLRPHADLGGISPKDWILDSSLDLWRVIEVARARFLSDQGAG